MQKDEPWLKVVAHGIPTADFKDKGVMEMILSEVTTIKKGPKPIRIPHWILTTENRQIEKTGSVVIAFATQEEANRAIRGRLYIAGVSCRVSKYYGVAPSTQCQKCQGHSHLDTYCRRTPSYALCGDKHSTQQHYCGVC